ncbi:hypothetical protein UCRPC4_g06063 [Phaeomoniella chlamydospora]|uniref:Uncharacterized protein n=1 Tax=Phaeomoniella chlamydospora TaxID=158046 RepID=A0A0G2DYE4_PHACM|nr:hypothetical protein UCRPC4_g06063 [Phaeomoniella chlamydospora]
MAYASLNTEQPLPSSSTQSSFEITTPPGTDLWRKPPSIDDFTAPIIYRTVSLSKFRRARISFSASWLTLYDQGGIVFALPQRSGSGGDKVNPKFIKAGIEFYENRPQLSVVAVDRWADWSLFGVPPSLLNAAAEQGSTSPITTIELEREKEADGTLGSSLWVYLLEGNVRKPLREVTWIFHELDQERECWVGAFAAKPTADSDDPSRGLTVAFENFEVHVD